MSMTKVTCTECDGAGLCVTPNKHFVTRVTMCKNCKGHGVVLYDPATKKEVTYDVTKAAIECLSRNYAS